LDGTNNFVSGNFDCVTTVIGLSIKGESRIGIVHNEYFDINYDWSLYGPRTFFATLEHGAYYLDGTEDLKSVAHQNRVPNYMIPNNLTAKPEQG
jgi:fructose-1,6-bisphosphatase/inositol monophosphatase family enzyme